MKQANDTKTAILDTALDLVQRQSISGVSFQELARLIGIKKGSMYYHFESKEALALAILQRAVSDLKASFERGQNKPAVAQLHYFMRLYRDYIGAGNRICPGGAFAGEWQTQSEAIQQQVQRLIQTQLSGVRHILEQGIAEGVFNDRDLDSESLAQWIVSTIQGALLTSRVAGSKVPYDQCVQAIDRYLGVSETHG